MTLKIDGDVAIELSCGMVEAYCRKDLSFIPVHLDERTFFIGPREGQILRSGTELNGAWVSDLPMPDFEVEDVSASSVITSPTTCEVLLHYQVVWHRDDRTTLEHPQVMQISWFVRQTTEGRREDSPDHDHYKVAVMHISNPEELDERDLVYNTFGDIATSGIGHVLRSQSEQCWVTFPGVGAVINRYPAGSILWVESASQGHQSVVHTRGRDIRCTSTLSWFVERYPQTFLRPSVSFIVNPAYVRTVRRFSVELWGGKVLRIPEKKYATFRRELTQYLERAGEDDAPRDRRPSTPTR